jgi:hypothetical protein
VLSASSAHHGKCKRAPGHGATRVHAIGSRRSDYSPRVRRGAYAASA